MVRNKDHNTRHYAGNYVKNVTVSVVYVIQVYTTCIIEINFKFLFSYYFF
jgi:hypothetical protein